MIPEVTVSAVEHEKSCLNEASFKQAVKQFRLKGCLLIKDIFSTELIETLHTTYLEQYSHYFFEKHFDDALTVGDKRYKISINLIPPFDTPDLYDNPIILPIIKELLGKEAIVSSFASVTSLPHAKKQNLHRDHPSLFNSVIDRLIPSYAIKLVIPLVLLNPQTGTTRLWPASHIEYDDAKVFSTDSVDPQLSIGDCFLMDYRLMHQGLANLSSQVRPVLYLAYSRPWFQDYENFKKQEKLMINS